MEISRQRFLGHRGRIFDCCFNPKGDKLATASEDGTTKLWNVSSGTCDSTISGVNGKKDEILRVNWSTSGNFMATGSSLGLVTIINAEDGSSRGVCDLKALRKRDSQQPDDDEEENDQVYVCDFFHKTDNTILLGSDDTLRVWDIEHNRCPVSLKMPATEPNARNPEGSNFVFGACMHFQDNYLAAALADNTLRLYDVRASKCVMVLTGHTKFATSCSFSPDRDLMFSSSGDGTARVWDTRRWQCIRVLAGHQGSCYGCKLFPQEAVGGPDPCVVATWSLDCTVNFWDLIGQRHVVTKQPRYPVLNMDVSRDNGCIALVGGKSDDFVGVPVWRWDAKTDNKYAIDQHGVQDVSKSEPDVSKSESDVSKSESDVSKSEHAPSKPVKRSRESAGATNRNNWLRWLQGFHSLRQLPKRSATSGVARPLLAQPRTFVQPAAPSGASVVASSAAL